MNIRALRYFLAIAETLSISRAATRCGIAQPSLSLQLRELEKHFGRRLFDRLSRGVRLTDGGRALLPHARRIVAEANALESAVRSDLDAGRGQLLLGAIPTMAPYLLPRLLSRFSREFPDCELTIREDVTANLVDALLDHELDLAILSTPIEQESILTEVVGNERLLLVTPRDHTLSRRRRPLGIVDLQDLPAVVLHEMHCLSAQIEQFCSARRVRRRIVCRTTQLGTVLELVSLGLGVSIVPEMCARADTSRRRRYVALGRRGPTREIAVAYHADRTRSQLGRILAHMLREDLASGAHLVHDV
jgi:LysR family hydrogen peroxide-inducible transcriptional activator